MWSVRLLRKHWNRLQALRRRREGVAAIEFSLIAIPFFVLLFAILETGYVFLLSILLEGATADGARQIRTGFVKAATPEVFENLVCTSMYGMIDCGKFIYDVRNFADFKTFTETEAAGVPDDPKTAPFFPGNAGDVVVVRVMYKWTFITPFLENLLGAGKDGTRHLVSSVALVNEPFDEP